MAVTAAVASRKLYGDGDRMGGAWGGRNRRQEQGLVLEKQRRRGRKRGSNSGGGKVGTVPVLSVIKFGPVSTWGVVTVVTAAVRRWQQEGDRGSGGDEKKLRGYLRESGRVSDGRVRRSE